MLYLIGIGLGDEKDITVKGLDAVKKCSKVYLESYTSKLVNATVEDLEKFYGKKINVAFRTDVENDIDKILSEATKEDIALLVIGDPLGATTHTGIMLDAKEKNVKIEVVHNASILNVIGEVGLELYKFGAITSIPFGNKDVSVPVDVFNKNYSNDMHTLFLLDLDPSKDKYMTIGESIGYLISKGVSPDLIGVGCGGLGGDGEIISGKLEELRNKKLKKFPQCLIIPSKKLHFVEEDSLNAFSS